MVTQPSAKSAVIRNTGALRTLRLRHREMIFDLEGLHDPGIAAVLPLNPGLQTSFPWLSNIANNFETYKFNSLSVEFIPAVGTSTDGALSIAPDYDATDNDELLSKRTLLAFEDTVRGPLWQAFTMTSS